jgi:hypothetical protein
MNIEETVMAFEEWRKLGGYNLLFPSRSMRKKKALDSLSPVSCVLAHPRGKLRRSVPLHVLSQART